MASMAEDPVHILIVDDDDAMRGLVATMLGRHRMDVTEVADGAGLADALAKKPPDLILLDVGLPDADGFALLRELRADNPVPVIMLTGHDTAIDRVLGLEFGADDYVTKPFEPRELLARIKNVLRRCQGVTVSDVRAPVHQLSFGDFILNVTERRLNHVDGQEIELTSGEFDLLFALADAANRPLSRYQLLDQIRSREWAPFDRSIDVLIGRLRAKIEPDRRNPTIIKTLRNAGYAMVVPVRRMTANIKSG